MEQTTFQGRALFLPFMQIPTGHHHVADALINDLQHCTCKMPYDKVDILSYSFGKMEKVVSASYLTWIKLLPSVYHWLYYHAAYKDIAVNNRNYAYELLFKHFFKQLILDKKPSIMFCTHALPSNIASVLKQNQQLDAIIVNVYTDFFVNRVWGLQGVDYHFAPTKAVKEYLVEKGVKEERIFITGIPVHSAFERHKFLSHKPEKLSVLVTGGNLGVGAMEQLLAESVSSNSVHYHVLCGKNKRLYQKLLRKNNANVTPYSYITCREKMNNLYDEVDSVLTKPGGVTISESLFKQKPIFVYNPLPGQERINAEQLHQQGLVMPVNTKTKSIEQQIINYFHDKEKQEQYRQKIIEYQQNLEKKPVYTIIDEIITKN